MGPKFKHRLLEIVVLLVGLCTSWTNSGTGDPYFSQPRLIIQNGHLVFQTAQNHNISFVSTQGGSIRINNDDIVQVVEQAKRTNSDIQQFGLSNLNNLNEQVSTLKSQLAEISNVVSRLNELEANYTRTSNQVNQLSQQYRNLNRRNIRQRLSAVETKVAELDTALQENNCQSDPCRNGATCIDAYKDFICQCPNGWQGKSCDVDVNECQEFLGTNQGCQNGGTCVNTIGSYSCNCPPNRYGVHCTQEQDHCSTASHQQLCAHGTCINENNPVAGQSHYRCICDQGWTNAPGRPACDVDIDECSQFHPSCSQNPPVLCINLPGTFHCGSCPAGYSGNGHTCSDINECAINNGGCSMVPMVQCINTPGSRMCGSCPPGYNGDGIRCDFTDVCSMNNGGCHQLATCVTNTAISTTYRECHCPSGYSGSGVGPNGCAPSAGTACESNPCLNGRCQALGNSYRCICSAGYTGTYCENTVDACHSNPCRNGGTCVTIAGGGFTCSCTESWQGMTCEEEIESCGGHLQGEAGNLQYPSGEIGQYRHGASCGWVISSPNPLKVLNLTFASFNLEYSYDCSFDFLQINDGPSVISHLVGRFCGTTPPGNGSLITTYSSVYLWFKSDESEARDGFHIFWTSTDPVCGGNLTGDHGTIKSPGYPSGYPHNRDCYWKVSVSPEKRIKFHFVDFRIEHHEDCSYDYLQIYDGLSEYDPVLKTYCGIESSIAPITASGPTALLHFHSDASLSDAGFQIAYFSEQRIAGCGGLLTDASGHLFSPHFPNIYTNNLRCEWLIRLPPGERIELNFTFFDVEGHSTCGYDYVEVIDGENEGDALIGRYCNNIRPPRIVSSSNKMRIIFSTDYSLQRGGFLANYTTACGGTFTDIAGDIHSPGYPNHYPLSKTCYYHIIVPQGNIIELNFLFFDIESSYYSDCDYDYLEVRDVSENGALLQKLCGEYLPGVIRSSYNRLWMKFVSDGSIQNLGFLLNYTTTEIGCGGIPVEQIGIISTPNSVTEHGFMTCNWLLRADPGSIVKLQFVLFSLRFSDNCEYEYVEIFDSGGERIGRRYCGDQSPPALTSTDNEMKVTFRTYHENLPEGFSASYQYLDAIHACGGDFYTQSGIVRSPGFATGSYPHRRDCTWTLHSESNKQISVHFTTFHLENHSQCNYDFLEIRNGGYVTSPLIGKYCGDSVPSNFTSHSNALFLHFVSDYSFAAPGFELFYESTVEGCGGIVTSPEGSITSPNFPEHYQHNAECNWLIQVAQGSVIKFLLRDVDIESHRSCDYDFVAVYDGDSDRAPQLIKTCGTVQHSEQLTSRNNKIFIKFRTDFSASGRGFQLVYAVECNTVLTGHRGVIESPNFPSPYPHNLNCTWTIKAPLGNNISIAFSHLALEYSSDCNYDSLEILERSIDATENQIVKYCARDSVPEPIVTSSNIALIRFLSDHSVALEGFRLEWQVRGCGGHLAKSFGIIQSPNYPNSYPLSVDCIWYITVQPEQRIEFTIDHVSLEGSEQCMYDYVKVFGGEDENSHEIGHWCGNINQPQTVTSHGNHMMVHFHSDVSYGGMGFTARYVATSGGCGGLFRGVRGTITSPNYNSDFDPDDDCTWTVEVGNNYLVQITLEDFNISPSSPNCSSSYLAIYDGSSEEDGTLMLRHCGDQIPTPATFKSTSNYLFLHMKPDGQHSSRGFKATYTAVCGARINADDGGEITSPNYPHAMRESEECTWILYATDLGEKITIVVTDLSTSLDYNANCTYQRVEIRSGTDSLSPLVQQFCGFRVPPSIVSPGNTVYIYFRGNKFRATYGISNNVCGGTFLAEHGTFTSPDYPNSYPVNTECVWNISAAAGNRIQLSFSYFGIEESEYCNSDFVEIREEDDSGNLIGKYCGSSSPGNLTTVSGRFWIKFRSDETGTQLGFVASYSLVHGVELRGREGIIESPGYPHFTHRDEEFTWLITVPSSMYVRIEFLLIDLEEQVYGSCVSYVVVIDGISQYGIELNRYCTRTIPEPIVTSSNTVTIKFYNGYVLGRWQLKWTAVQEPNVSPEISYGNACWENLNVNSSNTTIQSPGYPNGYEALINCTWMIHAGEHRQVKIDFLDINIEGHMPNCYYDKVALYAAGEGLTGSWSNIAKYCGRFSSPISVATNSVAKLVFTTDSFYSVKGFKAVARSECGGKFYSPRGILNTSDAAPSYGRPPCKWLIVARPGRIIRLRFEEFNIPDESSCRHQYLLIRNGGGDTSPFLGAGKYCNSNRPSTLESTSNQLYIELTSQYNYYSPQHSPTFQLHYEEVSMGCGGRTHLTNDQRSVIITSPNHPNPPPHDIDCQWIVMGPPNSRLRLDFNSPMDIENDCHSENSTEAIEVRDGGTVNSNLIGRFCGTHQPSSTYSTGNVMYLRYVTSGRAPRSGFNATILIAKCGGLVYGYNISLTSPNYPMDYENNLDCVWLIKTWQSFIFKIYFEDMAIVDDAGCYNDYVLLREESETGYYLGKKCGAHNISDFIQSEQYIIYVKFKTNATGSGRGFKIRFLAEHSGCGGEIRNPSGSIESPGFPYPVNYRRYCHWQIFVEEGRIVSLTFDHFNLQEDPVNHTCINALLVWNNTDIPWSFVREYWICGNNIPGPFDSTDNVASVFYYSHGNMAGEGFRLTFSSNKAPACGGKLTGSNGTISSPGFENGTLTGIVQCVWRLRNERDVRATLVFQFDVLDLPSNSTNNCLFDYLVIQEGDITVVNHNSRHICGNYTGQSLLVSTPAPAIMVALRKNSSETVRGFNASYSTQECGGEIEVGTSGTSPQYPNNYPSNCVCHWRINTEDGNEIKLSFSDFELESDCTKDYVEIRNGERYDSPVIKTLCGNQLPSEITSGSNHLTIVFHSDKTGSARGFYFTTSQVQRGCGGIVRGTTTFSSPVIGNINLYPNNAECIWLLESDIDYHHNVTFVNRFDIEMSQNCSNDYVQIDDYENSTWKFLNKFCGNTRPTQTIGKSNHMRVTFRSNAQVQADGFTILHTVACGRTFFMEDFGIISSPGYPHKYNDNLTCEYLIQNSQQSYITLQFDAVFSIEDHPRCGFDSLTIYSGNSISTPVIGNYCGNAVPGPFVSRGAMLLIFKTDWVVTTKGFRATFNVMSCGGQLNSPEGTFRTPYIPTDSDSSVTCTWRITVQPERVIELRFSRFNMSAISCYQGSVEIYDGNSTVRDGHSRTYCGNDSPPIIKSAGRYLMIGFYLRRSFHSKGFEAAYRTTFGPDQGCGGRHTTVSGEISSLDFDQNGKYESGLDCIWYIYQRRKLVHITFTSMDIEPGPANNGSCPYDYVEVRDGYSPVDPIIGKFCGTEIPREIVSTAGRVMVHFHSDYTDEQSGFHLTYEGKEPNCGGSLYVGDEPQRLTSPNYSQPYEPNLRCQWRFYSNNSRYDTIELTFEDMEIPCGGDYLQFREDGVDNRPLQFCGQNAIHHFRASHGLVMNFVTNTEGAGRGFSLTYAIAGCSRNYTRDNGIIKSMIYSWRYYSSDQSCDSIIYTKEGRTISLYFNKFENWYQAHPSTCSVKRMEVYEGTDDTGPRIGRFCTSSLPNPIFSHSNALFVRVYGIVYSISYTTTDQGQGCGGNLSSVNGSFTSPKYPFPCNVSTQCRWYITVPGEHTLTLNFLTFGLNSTRGCETNYVEIYETHEELTSNRVGRYCGTDHPAVHSSLGNTLMVKMVTNTNNNFPGFRATFHTNALGGPIQHLSHLGEQALYYDYD